MSDVFDERAAAGYESWYETPEGARADALEKAALQKLLEGFSEARPAAASHSADGAHSVLEVGCGTGHFTRWLHDLGWSAVGLDISAPMLTEAQALNEAPLVRGDAFRLPFADGSFDVASFITTLEFLEYPDAALAEAVRVARRGVLLGVLNRWSILGVRRRLSGLFRTTVYDQARFYGVNALEERLRAAAEDGAHVVWCTTLFPSWKCHLLPSFWRQARLPWGGFIAMALHQA